MPADRFALDRINVLNPCVHTHNLGDMDWDKGPSCFPKMCLGLGIQRFALVKIQLAPGCGQQGVKGLVLIKALVPLG